jgi:Repeat of unknown function (DUF5907)
VAPNTLGRKYGFLSSDSGRLHIYDSTLAKTFFILNISGATGKIGLGNFGSIAPATLPDSTVHIIGGFKLVNGTQGLNKVLVSDASGGTSWQIESGDVTSATTSGSLITTIGANKVTYAKMQAASLAGRLLGSSSTGTAITELKLGTGLSISNDSLKLTSTGGTGTVTGFSSGSLAPLFTTTVATPSNTPALSFALTPQSSNLVFAGPGTGAALAPSFRALVAADIPTLATSKLNFTNTARLLGRFTAGTGTAEEITLGTGLSLSGTGVLSSTGGSGGSPVGNNGNIQIKSGALFSTPALDSLNFVTGQGLSVKGTIRGNSGSNAIVLEDGNGRRAFASYYANAWADNQSTQFAQIGDFVDKVAYTSRGGLNMSRALFAADKLQVSAGNYVFIPAPVDNFEIINAANTKIFGVDTAGRVKFSAALMPNNIAGTAGQVLTSAGAGAAPTWSLPTAASVNAWGLAGNTGANPATNFIGTTDAQRLVFKTNNTEQATISSNGNVGIGTTTVSDTTYRLFVEKGIRTRKIKVDIASWPDYVFKPNYKLPSLNELEKYLQNNQHLPDMPSAKDVEKDGIDLGSNQAILLKKVEELTLYMIDLNKKIEALTKENEALKKNNKNPK